MSARALVPALILILAGCTSAPAEESASPGSAAAVAVRQDDLTGEPRRCEFSGPVGDFAGGLGPMATESARRVAEAWVELQKVGALEGHLAAYGDTERACRYYLTGPPEGDIGAAGRLASTLVVTFTDPSAAVDGYRADVLGQAQAALAAGESFRSAPASGLGPYSTTRYDDATTPASGTAVWQAGAFNIYLQASGLSRGEFERVAGAVDLRARAPENLPNRERR